MGKPRMIILIRHAQSEGNKNRDIHQMVPDHRVKLTEEGKRQAIEAGHRLRGMLKPDDTIQFFTSPYRRTRETTEGILSSLTASDPEHGPSPFPRHTIKVFEEPRLREQDFGNFQPCSAEMERMWQERADYGHFFYRIANGESAADAYDRVSGFNESLWRNFSEPDFPSVCVLVTHGLMTRVFLMKWYHWSVEYFEDLRNVNHCEFVIMRQDPANSKYLLENQLRTWSELKRRAAATANSTTNPGSANLTVSQQHVQLPIASPTIPVRKWGGCQDGCNHQNPAPRRRRNTQVLPDISLPPAADVNISATKPDGEQRDQTLATQIITTVASTAPISASTVPSEHSKLPEAAEVDQSSPESFSKRPSGVRDVIGSDNLHLPGRPVTLPMRPGPNPYNHFGRDAGGSLSGAATPAEGLSDVDSDGGPGSNAASSYFLSIKQQRAVPNPSGFQGTKNAPSAHGRGSSNGSNETNRTPVREKPRKRPTVQDLQEWAKESGMGAGARADPLGDEADTDEAGSDGDDEEGGRDLDTDEVERNEEEDKSLRGSVY